MPSYVGPGAAQALLQHKLARHGDNPTGPVLPWEAIPTNHFHKQAMNLNYDVKQENISNNCHRKSLNLNSGATCRVNGRSYAFAILQITQGTAHWNSFRLTVYYQQKGEILPRHTHTPSFSVLMLLAVCTHHLPPELVWTDSAHWLKKKSKSAEMQSSASSVSRWICPQERPKPTWPSGRERSGWMQLGTEEGQGDSRENKRELFCSPTRWGSHL